MNVNILVDFKENGRDKNEPHIVCGVRDEITAGKVVKKKLESRGCKVQCLTVIEGRWTLEQLHDMANYGDYLDKVNHKIIYLSDEMIEYFRSIHNNPDAANKIRAELSERIRER